MYSWTTPDDPCWLCCRRPYITFSMFPIIEKKSSTQFYAHGEYMVVGGCNIPALVPPWSLSLTGWELNRRQGRAICARRHTLPAVPMSALTSASTTLTPPLGLNSILVDCRPQLSNWPEHRSLTSLSPVRCCEERPGFFRPARMFSIDRGLSSRAPRHMDIRRICPPPSRIPPSNLIMSVLCRKLTAGGSNYLFYYKKVCPPPKTKTTDCQYHCLLIWSSLLYAIYLATISLHCAPLLHSIHCRYIKWIFLRHQCQEGLTRSPLLTTSK